MKVKRLLIGHVKFRILFFIAIFGLIACLFLDIKKDDEEENEGNDDDDDDFSAYPLNISLSEVIENYRNGSSVYTPMDGYEYNFKRNPKHTCFEEDEVVLILLVKSATENYERRKAIRKTWADLGLLYALKFRVVFIVGLSADKICDQRILREADLYNDILQIDFYDTYYNNTLKVIGTIEWVKEFCSGAQFALFVDDDYFVSTTRLSDYVKWSIGENTTHIHIGNLNRAKPFRNKTSKWYISEQDYPYKRYPPYLSGGGWLASKSFIIDLSIGIQYTKRFIYDDVFIGFVAYKLKVKPFHDPRFSAEKILYTDKAFKTTIASHGYGDPKELIRVWDETSN